MTEMIITADDFGMKDSIDNAILEALNRDLITDVSLVPNGENFENAVRIASRNNLSVGVHLGLILEQPVRPPLEVPTLVDEDDYLPPNYRQFILRYVSGRISLDEITRELRAQITKIKSEGLTITHLNSHQHLHMLPGIFPTVLDLAHEFDIPGVRISNEHLVQWKDFFNFSLISLKAICGYARIGRSFPKLVVPDHFMGINLARTVKNKNEFRSVLQETSGITELGIHLAKEPLQDANRFPNKTAFKRTFERLTEPSFKALLEDTDCTLTSFSELASESITRET